MKTKLLLSALLVAIVTNAQNVGIEVTNPVNKLQIGALPAGVSGNHLAIGNGSQAMSFLQSTTSNWYTTTNFALLPGTGGTGYVGIGLANPDHKLTVLSNSIEANNNTQLLGLRGRNPVLTFATETNVGIGYLKAWTNAATPPYFNGLVIGTNPGYPMYLSTNNFLPTMTLTDIGTVGIGTTTPATKLHVAGNGDLLRLSGTNPTISLYDGSSNFKGYMWIKGTDDIEIGTGGPNTNGKIDFSIRGTPYLSIQNNGRVSVNGIPAINTTDLGGLPKFTVNGPLCIKDNFSVDEWTWVSSTSSSRMYLYWNGISKAQIDQTDGDWTGVSDISLKENTKIYKPVLEGVKKLQVSTYHFKDDYNGKISFGLIAQNVAEYFPEIVSEFEKKDGKSLLGITYAKTGVLAIKAIQEQQVIIENQQRKIDELEKRLAALEKNTPIPKGE